MNLLAILVPLLLAGCITPEQRAAQESAIAHDREMRRQAYLERLTSQCQAIGYQPGTDGMRQCVLQLHTSNQAERGLILQQLLRHQGIR